LNPYPEGLVSRTSAAANYATRPMESTVGIEPTMDGVAARRLTDWPDAQKFRGNNNCTGRVAIITMTRSAVER
jgi:hypothetical protein